MDGQPLFVNPGIHLCLRSTPIVDSLEARDLPKSVFILIFVLLNFCSVRHFYPSFYSICSRPILIIAYHALLACRAKQTCKVAIFM